MKMVLLQMSTEDHSLTETTMNPDLTTEMTSHSDQEDLVLTMMTSLTETQDLSTTAMARNSAEAEELEQEEA